MMMRIVKVFDVCGVLAVVCGCIADGPHDKEVKDERYAPASLFRGTFAW